jgi:hypothetical protein
MKRGIAGAANKGKHQKKTVGRRSRRKRRCHHNSVGIKSDHSHNTLSSSAVKTGGKKEIVREEKERRLGLVV